MRRLMVGALLVGVVAAQAQERVYVEVDAPSSSYVQMPVVVTLTVGWDAAWFAEHGVEMLRQKTDAPLHVDVPWLRAAPERAVEFVVEQDPSRRATTAVGDRLVDGTWLEPVERDGRSFARVQLTARWMPLSAGPQAIEPVRVRYAYADEFREHLLRGREPVARKDGEVRSAARELRVQRLPTLPPDDAEYTGAVGDFVIEVQSASAEVHVGEPFAVEMVISGDGNLERFRKPAIPALDGFHVQGIVEKKRDGARAFVFDCVALRDGLDALPGLSFVTFSPSQDRYVRFESGPVPLRTLARREGVELPAAVEELIRQDARERSSGSGYLRWLFVALAIVGVWLHRRGTRGRRRQQLDSAMHELQVATGAQDPARMAAAFEQLLARVGGGETFAAPGAWDALRDRGVTPEGLLRLKELQQTLDAARFGGPLPDRDDLLAAADTVFSAARH